MLLIGIAATAVAVTVFFFIIRFIVTRPLIHGRAREPGLLADEYARVKCGNCSGGTQSLTDGKWGKIPAHHLNIDRHNAAGEDDIYRAPIANVRKCKCCTGMGFHLYPKYNVTTGAPVPVPERCTFS